MPRKRLTSTAPNRLLDVDDIYILPTGDIGILNMESDDGTIEMAITCAGAALLMGKLMEFQMKMPPDKLIEVYGTPTPFDDD